MDQVLYFSNKYPGMKLTVLVDNNTLIDRYFLAEPGLSLLIEDSGLKVLFDVGYSDIFITNARKMGINLLDIDFLVFSHGHLDHTWGLDPLVRHFTEARIEGLPQGSPSLVAHPLALRSKRMDGVGEIGSLFSREKLEAHFELRLSSTPLWLNENLVFLGEIPRRYVFEGRDALGDVLNAEGYEESDLLFDDTALACKTRKGLVVITGCSHSGICNIIEYAKEVCREERVLDIIGGFHLLEPPEIQVQGTLEYLQNLKPECVHACHCTDLSSKIELAKVVNLNEVGVGLELEYG